MTIFKQYGWQIALVILAFGFVFSILGVYDTHGLPFYMRFTFWTVTMATGILATIVILPFLVTRAMKGYPPVLQVITAALLASVPVTLVLTIFNPAFDFDSSLKLWGIQFGYVLIISLIVGGTGYPFLRKIGAYGDSGSLEITEIKRFLERLPLKYHDANLYGFSAEDHYLRVYTDRGDDLVLMRFADAMQALAHAGGLQVHRSWWVRQESVTSIRNEAGKKFAVLKSNVEAPISRTFMKDVKRVFSL